MGLRRRLSKKWNETVNGVLSGPGVDVDSVNTGEVNNTNGTGFAAMPFAVSDDFNDGLLTSRNGAREAPYVQNWGGGSVTGRYRPEWSETQNATVTNGEVVLAGGSVALIRGAPTLEYGEWEFGIEPQAAPDGIIESNVVYESDNSRWYIRAESNGSYNLEKKTPSGTTVVISSSWPADASRYRFGAARYPSNEWFLFLDGQQKGSKAQDSFEPQPNSIDAVAFNGTVDVHVDNVEVR